MDQFVPFTSQPASEVPSDSSCEYGDGGMLSSTRYEQPVFHRSFAQQPIYTVNRELLGFELFHRNSHADHFCADPDFASRMMIDNLLLFGFEELSTQSLVFVNCTRDTLISGFFPLLPPSNAVIEILETVRPDAEVLAACHVLKERGYRISLDDFEDPGTMMPFLDLADFVKIDFRLSHAIERQRLVKELEGRNIIRIAEKIETEEEFRIAAEEGYSLFQGYYLQKPTTLSRVRFCPNPRHMRALMEILLNPRSSFDELVEYIHLEPDIEERLLRRATWKAPAGHPIESVRQALHIVGREELKLLLRLALLTMFPVQPSKTSTPSTVRPPDPLF